MRRLGVFFASLALVGCAAFGYESTTVSIPRDPLLVAYGETRARFQILDEGMAIACPSKPADPFCSQWAGLRARALTLDGILQAALASKPATLNAQDLDNFLKVAQAGLSIAAGAGLNVGTIAAAAAALIPK